MDTPTFRLHHWLAPLAWIYGAVTAVRNRLFDRGALRSESFGVPTICVGNLAVGGTGKTPHTEYLIRLLRTDYRTAVLSRGYKRRTSGYVLATPQSRVEEIGDEPFQMLRKFDDITIAVDEDRRRGLRRLMKLDGDRRVEVVLLDDAFQHRRIKAGLNILLTDYHRLFRDDKILPVGRLRESANGKERAQIIVVSKCPDTLKPIDFNIIAKRLDPCPYQRLYFSRVRYGEPRPVFPAETDARETGTLEQADVLLVTGIASPADLLEKIRREAKRVESLAFGDHHAFGRHDLALVRQRFDTLPPGRRLIVTTEKDAARLATNPDLDPALRPFIYAIPIEVEILRDQETTFNKQIIDYVRENKRDSNLPQGKDAYQSRDGHHTWHRTG
ncbi:MAG: tetraacyldisaccharide 4'-kinase [Mediterranea sp.]|jgi:tetraacyldisaccharide 4'-kinase|nr:tetraacyldisaccharide 4'-kinase [Mediterranea sp.]